MNRSLLNATFSLVLVCLVGWLLIVGRNLIVPFVIALVVWYIIDTLAKALEQVPLVRFRLPRWFSLPLAMVAIIAAFVLVVDMVATNVSALAADAPVYQQRLIDIYNGILMKFDLGEDIDFDRLLPNFNLSRFVSGAATAFTGFAGSTSLIFIYVLFLLIEQSTFDGKLRAIFADADRARFAFDIRDRITDRIRNYLGIKTAVSVVTGLISYGVLALIGVKYAALFGFLIFLLNYIPTIGSLIGVVFPALLALVQFDTLVPFIAVVGALGVVQFSIGNILEPRLMGTSLNLSGLVIMLSLALWGAIWGITGMVLCVPLTVIVMIICAQFPSTRPVALLLSAHGHLDDLVMAGDQGAQPPISSP